jgi:hypothetical protein
MLELIKEWSGLNEMVIAATSLMYCILELTAILDTLPLVGVKYMPLMT